MNLFEELKILIEKYEYETTSNNELKSIFKKKI